MAAKEDGGARGGSGFPDWLMEILARREWSQRRLAAKIGVTSGAVSRWVRGLDVPSSVNVIAIAEAFGLDPAVVMHRVAGTPAEAGYLAAMEEELTEEEMESVRAFAQYVKGRRARRDKT